MSEKLEKLRCLVKDKTVMLVCHYDADGVTSGAMIYHLIKDYAKEINTLSKGLVFRVEPEDIEGDPDVIITVDIKPSTELDLSKVAYIDHHPMQEGEEGFLFSLHDDQSQSCSLLIWKELMPLTNDPYMIFLTLLGYFGDGGKIEDIPLDLEIKANELLKVNTSRGVHNLMERKSSRFSSGDYLEIQRYVSAINTGKRMHWHGNVPLELLKNIKDFKQFIYNIHPLAQQLQEYRYQLRSLYDREIDLQDTGKVQYATIECEQNIQGVLCARHMNDKPIIVFNKYNGMIIASMRVPDDLDFDAGSYLAEFKGKIDTVVGGGHEKAGGVTFEPQYLPRFIELMRQG